MGKKIKVVPWTEMGKDEAVWDSFVEEANGGNIFHKLSFLKYHQEKFQANEYQLVFVKGESIFGLMPMAIFKEAGVLAARSPYGASYGGPIFRKKLSYSESMDVVGSLLNFLSLEKIHKITITLPIPPIYREYCDTFTLALYENKFRCVNQDISSIVALRRDVHEVEERFDSRARNMIRKAVKNDVSIMRNTSLDIFWPVLLKTFEKHGTEPTHSFDDVKWLMRIFPEQIYCSTAMYKGNPIAGICFFEMNRKVNSTFYFANDPQYQHLQGLSFLISDAIKFSTSKGYAFLDFGTSSVNMQGRSNIFKFKEGFGATGCFRKTFEWEK